jgi:SWIM zinc finger
MVGYPVGHMRQIQVVKRQSRYSKGVVIATSRQILKVHNENAWLVESETTDDKFYKVTEDGTSDCMDFQKRGGPCKHMWALISRGIA